MYGKIFDSIYDGTLRVNWQALVTFQQFIILANKDGVVDMTPHAIHGRTGIPLEIIEAGIEHLSKPDPYSRSSSEDGRRIVPIDKDRPWGWRLVNHDYYNRLRSAEEKREADRERVAKKRSQTVEKPDASQPVADSRGQSRTVAEVAPVSVSVTVSKNKREGRFTPPTLDEVIAYCRERDNKVSATRFVNFYESKNWMVGKNKMKDWMAAVRGWEEEGTGKPKGKMARAKESLRVFNDNATRNSDGRTLPHDGPPARLRSGG